MPFPSVEQLLLPLLEAVADGAPHSVDDLGPTVARRLVLTAEDITTPGPRARNTMLEYRLHWARTMLHKAELVTIPGELLLQITDAGRDVLAGHLPQLDGTVLAEISPAYAQWQVDMGNPNIEPTLRSSGQALWVIRAGEGGSQAAKFLQHDMVAIGWAEHSDLTGRDRDSILIEVKTQNPHLSRRAIAQGANSLFRLASVIREGDVVLTPEPGSKTFLLGEVRAPYRYVSPPLIGDYSATRWTRWFARIGRADLSHGARSSLGTIMTMFQPGYQLELLAIAREHWTDPKPAPLPSVVGPQQPTTMIERVDLPEDALPPTPYSGETFATDKNGLLFLLSQIENRQLGLPDFQRTFVWEPSATRELIVSVMQGFPAGALLFLRNEGRSLAPRSVEGAPELSDNASPSSLILDGQQRLSSLYHAFYGAGRYSFFLDIGALIRHASVNDAVKVLPPRMVEPLREIKTQSDMLMMPLSRVRDASDWADEVLDARQGPGVDHKPLRTMLRAVDKAYVEPIRQYQFPVTVLPSTTPLEAVCTIFETLNRTGEPLTVFELICARAFANGASLLRMWQEACSVHPVLTTFQVEPYYLLQVIALRSGASCKRSAVLALRADEIAAHWPEIATDFAATLRMLRDDCGVLTPKWLPYRPMLVPLVTAWRQVARATGPAVASKRARLQRWFWCAAFTGEYESSSVSLSERDAPALREWLDGADEPEVVRDFAFDPERWRTITPRQQGAYRATIALLLREGPRDFHTAVRLTPEVIAEQDYDDHHIFPRGFFKDELLDYPVDTVLNHTLIDRLTNIRIGKKAPSKYLEDIRGEIHDKLDEILESHSLPIGTDSALWRNDFAGFCDYRLGVLSEMMAAATTES